MRILLLLLLLALPGLAESRRFLVVLSGANQLTLQGGKTHPTGFYLNELLVPVKILMDAGYEPVFATPGGRPPTLDAHSDNASSFGGDEGRYQAMKTFMAGLDGLRHPLALADVRLDDYCAVFVPGGHAPMQDLRSDPALGELLQQAHQRALPTALICHGPIALLSASKDPWPYRGYEMTIFSTAEEQAAESSFLGGRVLFYPDAALTEAGGKVSAAAKPFLPHVVVDRELITGQNPASDQALGEALLKALPGRKAGGD